MKIPGCDSTLENTRRQLLAERVPEGYWLGELSTSALSTATAVQALYLVDAVEYRDLIAGGVRWLIENQNADGGWGDTTLSFSNISTTLLCWSAIGLAEDPAAIAEAEGRAEKWISSYAGSLDPEAIKEAVVARYGKDRTFSVPILMMCAIAGRLGSEKEAWGRVLPLPFEIAALPRSLFGTLRLPVVSYALPALIAIGYARFYHRPPSLGPRIARRKAWPRASRVLEEIQPTSGGFLEATPLTSFVTMALASSGQKEHPVVPKAVDFLVESVRSDGSWPIDTDLATWGTTLAVKGLGGSGAFSEADRERVRGWLLNQQYREKHPYTDAAPGGWAWTDLPGGVPDADDTPGAMLALRLLETDGPSAEAVEAASLGADWLMGVQNRDGGIPTFCKGWGALPFDRSSPDLTAHTLRAWDAWVEHLDGRAVARISIASRRAITFLRRRQTFEGAWIPLWFGNQHLSGENNRTYGTSMVLIALAGLSQIEGDGVGGMVERGVDWLLDAQNKDGGWGGGERGESPSSIEETALAVEALAKADASRDAISRGVRWLVDETAGGTRFEPSPIGFYFAKLWYYERLYPMVWTASALAQVEAMPD